MHDGVNLPSAAVLECDIAKVQLCTVKRRAAGRTEPHQGSWVCSPLYNRAQVREIGKTDE